MGDDFGSEFVSVLDRVPFGDRGAEQVVRGEGLNVGPALDSVIAAAESAARGFGGRGVILFFPPGRYAVPFVPGRIDQKYVFPPNLELFFSPGALLRPELFVELIIGGTIRAGKHQIFGYSRYVNSGHPDVITTPQGRVILTSLLIPEVYPEWWGAFMPEGVVSNPLNRAGQDSSDAIQAAIDAACVNRDYPDGRVRRPSIPVILGAQYQCNRTLEVQLPSFASNLHFILRGSGGLAPIVGGLRSIIRVHEAGSAQDPSDCVLRLGPGVDFDIQDVSLLTPAEDPVSGCIDVVGAAVETAPRRGLFRRCALTAGSLYGLRIGGATGVVPRHIVVDSCEILPMNNFYQSLRGVDVSGSDSTMLHIDGTLMGTGILTLDRFRQPIVQVPRCATIYQTGASVLVRASQFHAGNGPRPSPAPGMTEVDGSLPIDLTTPDGQEVFLDSAAGARTPATSQFTAMQCEDQGWWFLSRAKAGDEQVVLLSVSHENVNWPTNTMRYHGPQPMSPETDPRGHPPSVIWLNAGGQCVLIACRLQDAVLTDNAGRSAITSAATFFKGSRLAPNHLGDLGSPQHFRDNRVRAAIIRPPAYTWIDLPSPAEDSFDGELGRVVPIRRFPIDGGRT